MLQPTALNFIVVGCFIIIFSFMWNMAASKLVQRNPDSPVGHAMAVFI